MSLQCFPHKRVSTFKQFSRQSHAHMSSLTAKRESYTVQTVTWLPPVCVLPNTNACIQMRLNITFYGKIGIFEDVCRHTRPSLVTTEYTCSPAISRNITQPCVLAQAAFCRTCVGELLTMDYHDLLPMYRMICFS